MDDLSAQAGSLYPRYVVQSLHDDCRDEEAAHKWRESEKAKHDLGEAAVRQWVRDHWDSYLRARWIEHIEGRKFWLELDRSTFGLMKTPIPACRNLYDPIFDKLKAGQENLDIVCWARRNGQPVELVCRFLEALDLNSCRLRHRFDDK